MTGILLVALGAGILGVLLVVRLLGARGGSPPAVRARPSMARLRRFAQTTLLAAPAVEPGFSKLGGLPELPSGIAWPLGDDEPRAFVAQIDFAEVTRQGKIDWLPSDGRIYAFFDDARNGSADVVKIIYSQDPPEREAEPPSNISKRWRFGERRIGFAVYNSVPSEDWLEVVGPEGLAETDMGVEAGEVTGLENFDLGDGVQHRIGGYPEEIQNGSLAIEAEYVAQGSHRDYRQDVPTELLVRARQWRLLLQIDSDDALKMNWWDGGRLFVFVREADARKGDFSRTVTLTQTH